MYKFRKPNEVSFPIESKLQTIINGKNLDKEIKGFRTLAVYGRELMSRNITTAEYRRVKVGKGMRSYVNRDTSSNAGYANRFIGSYLSSRSIVVEYDINAKDNAELFGINEQLNYLMDVEEVPIIFTDDPNFYYIGTHTNAEELKRNSRQYKSSFELECSNPFKFAVNTEEFKLTTQGQFKKMTYFPVKLESMKIVLKQAGAKLVIKNITNAQSIILDKNFIVGETIEIDFTASSIKNYMQYLDITSDLEEFEILYNDTINTSLQADVTVIYREVRL